MWQKYAIRNFPQVEFMREREREKARVSTDCFFVITKF